MLQSLLKVQATGPPALPQGGTKPTVKGWLTKVPEGPAGRMSGSQKWECCPPLTRLLSLAISTQPLGGWPQVWSDHARWWRMILWK